MNASDASTEKLVADLKRLMLDSEELLKDTAGTVGDKARGVRERLAQTLDSAKATCRRIEERAVEGAKATDKLIREHPYQSIGAAFGIGLLIGVLVARK